MTQTNEPIDISEASLKSLFAMTPAEAAVAVAKVGIPAFLAAVGAPGATDAAVIGLMDTVTRGFISKRYERFALGVVRDAAVLKEQIAAAAVDAEHFGTVFLQAAREATATHEREKLDALRNAVLNTALGIDIAEEQQLYFLSLISQLASLQIRILIAMTNIPGNKLSPMPSSPGPLSLFESELIKEIPELLGMENLYIQMILDLTSRGLSIVTITQGNMRSAYSSRGTSHGSDELVTPLGQSLIRYLSDPTAN